MYPSTLLLQMTGPLGGCANMYKRLAKALGLVPWQDHAKAKDDPDTTRFSL